MKILDKTPDLLERIKDFEPFQGIPEAALQWLIDHLEYQLFE